MAMIELVDFNEVYGKDAVAAAAKKTRRGRKPAGAAKKAETTTAEVATETPATETPAAETTETAE